MYAFDVVLQTVRVHLSNALRLLCIFACTCSTNIHAFVKYAFGSFLHSYWHFFNSCIWYFSKLMSLSNVCIWLFYYIPYSSICQIYAILCIFACTFNKCMQFMHSSNICAKPFHLSIYQFYSFDTACMHMGICQIHLKDFCIFASIFAIISYMHLTLFRMYKCERLSNAFCSLRCTVYTCECSSNTCIWHTWAFKSSRLLLMQSLSTELRLSCW